MPDNEGAYRFIPWPRADSGTSCERPECRGSFTSHQNCTTALAQDDGASIGILSRLVGGGCRIGGCGFVQANICHPRPFTLEGPDLSSPRWAARKPFYSPVMRQEQTYMRDNDEHSDRADRRNAHSHERARH